MNGAERDDTRPQMQAFAVLLALALLLAGFLLKDQILSRVIANYAAIQMIKAPGLQLIDFRAYPTCQNSDRYAQPASLFNRAVELDPYNRAAWQNLLKVRWAAGDCAAVEQMLTAGLSPEDSSLRLISALLDIQAGRFQGRASYPGAVEIGRLLAEAGLDADDQGLIDEAAQWYNSAFLLDPNLKTAEWLANHYAAQGDNDRIAWVWDYLAQEKGGTEDGWWAQFYRAELTDDLDRQVAALEAGAVSSTDPYQFLIELGQIFRQAKQYDSAITTYQRAIELYPEVVWPLILQGEVYLEIDNLDKALRRLTLAQSIEPGNPYSYFYLGVAYDRLNEPEKAISTLQTSIDVSLQSGINPWTMCEFLGSLLLKAGQCAEAKAAFEQALEWQPGEVRLIEAIQNLATCSN